MGGGGFIRPRVVTLGPPDTIQVLEGIERSSPNAWWRGLILGSGPGGVQAFRLAPGKWEVGGSPIHITAGSAREQYVTAANSGSLVFASITSNTNIWSLGINHNTGKPVGDLHRVTRNVDYQLAPSVSRDGRQFTFVSTIAGLILRDFESGQERVMVPGAATYPSMSPDGTRIAYNTSAVDPKTGKSRFEISVVNVNGGQKEKLCDDCGLAPFWSTGGRKILYDVGTPRYVGILDLDRKANRPLIEGSGRGVFQASFAPDDHWIAFEVEYGADHAGIAIAPFRDEARIQPSAWIPVTDGKQFDSRPRWAPGGNRLYFVSDRDGFRCIWTIALNQVTRRASGQPSPVFHLHDAQRSILNLGGIAMFNIAVSQDRLLFNLGETTGNIWLAESR